jgi:hypothetical protein
MVSLRKKRFVERSHMKRKLYLYYGDKLVDINESEFIQYFIKRLKDGSDSQDDCLWQEEEDHENSIEELFDYMNPILDNIQELLL